MGWVVFTQVLLIAAALFGAWWPVALMRRVAPSEHPVIVWMRRVATVLLAAAVGWLLLDVYANIRVMQSAAPREHAVFLALSIAETKWNYVLHVVPGMTLHIIATLLARYARPFARS